MLAGLLLLSGECWDVSVSMLKHVEDELPFRGSIESRLIDLIDGRITGDEAAAWALPFVVGDLACAQDRRRADARGLDVADMAAWKALSFLHGCDIKAIGDYVSGPESYQACLEELRRAGPA